MTETRVTDGVDTSMQTMELSLPRPTLDGGTPQTGLGQLRPGYHTVLPSGDLSHFEVGQGGFCTHDMP